MQLEKEGIFMEDTAWYENINNNASVHITSDKVQTRIFQTESCKGLDPPRKFERNLFHCVLKS